MKFRAFEKKDEYPRLIIPEIIYAERPGYLNVWKVLLRTPFANEQVNGFQTLLKLLLPSFLVNSR